MTSAWDLAAHRALSALLTTDATALGVTPRLIAERRGTLSFLGTLAGVPRPFLAEAATGGGRELELWRVRCTIPIGATDEQRLIREPTTDEAAREIGRLLRWWVTCWRPGQVVLALPALPGSLPTVGDDTERDRALERELMRDAAAHMGQRVATRLGTTDPTLASERLRERGMTVTDADSLNETCDAVFRLLSRFTPLDGDAVTTCADILGVTPEWLFTGIEASSPGTPL